jgi:antitoxin component YwqK of YwqJK toxin-antitoxin module
MLKKNITLLFFCFISIISYSQTTNDSINRTDAEGKRQGKWIITNKIAQKVGYADNQKVEDGIYVDGKKKGIWREYYANGNLKSVITYENNFPNGYVIMYHENGKIKEEGNWKNRRWIGAYKFYHENGQVAYDFNYADNGKRVGSQKYFYENGELMIEGNWADGQESGILKRYYENGDLKSEENYGAGGILDLATVKNYQSKKPVEETPKAVEKPSPPVVVLPTEKPNIGTFTGEGYWKVFNSSKQVVKDGTFSKNKLIDGKWYMYDKDGMLTRIAVYKEGRYVGDAIIEDVK